jgi:hypothetical protein
MWIWPGSELEHDLSERARLGKMTQRFCCILAREGLATIGLILPDVSSAELQDNIAATA